MSLVPQGELDHIAGEISGWFANATLLEITGPGAPDRNGDPGEGPSLWAGEAPGFLARERHDVITGGVQVPVRLDTFTLLDGFSPVVEAAGPDWGATRVTIRDDRTETPVTLVFGVTGMEHNEYGLLGSVLLTLEHGVPVAGSTMLLAETMLSSGTLLDAVGVAG